MVHHDSKPVEDMMKNFLPGFALVALVAAGPAMAADLSHLQGRAGCDAVQLERVLFRRHGRWRHGLAAVNRHG